MDERKLENLQNGATLAFTKALNSHWADVFASSDARSQIGDMLSVGRETDHPVSDESLLEHVSNTSKYGDLTQKITRNKKEWGYTLLTQQVSDETAQDEQSMLGIAIQLMGGPEQFQILAQAAKKRSPGGPIIVTIVINEKTGLTMDIVCSSDPRNKKDENNVPGLLHPRNIHLSAPSSWPNATTGELENSAAKYVGSAIHQALNSLPA